MSKIDDVKAQVKIPAYFYKLIVPQLGAYYSDYHVDFDVRPVACCPLHDENTPSMRYYEETNSFYCFGCRIGGDVIRLHREFTERQTGTMPTLSESVDFLYDFFIKGNEGNNVSRGPARLKVKGDTSTPIELARYSAYTEVLEKQLLVDDSVPEDYKNKIRSTIDILDILIDKNELNANSAEVYVKAMVDEMVAQLL